MHVTNVLISMRICSLISIFVVQFLPIHGVQSRMISVVNFFRIFEINIFCFVVAICDLVHAVEAMYGLP